MYIIMSYVYQNLRNIMNRYFGALALSFSFIVASAQEALYINVDPLCMDRYEYHINGETKGIEYIAYRVRQSQRDFVFLEVGAETTGMQLSSPENAKDCRNVRFTPDYIEKINTREVQVFIVRKSEVGYNISPVNLATYQYSDGSTYKYKGYGLDYFCNLGNTASQTNLADQTTSASAIFYAGDATEGCLKTYHFRKEPLETCKPVIDMDIIPEIGVVREVTRISLFNDHESMLNLVRVNDISIDSYIAKICEGKGATAYMPTTYVVETTDLSQLPVSEIIIDGQSYQTASSYSTEVVSSSSSEQVYQNGSDVVMLESSAMPVEYNANNAKITLTEKSGSSAVKIIKPKTTTTAATVSQKVKCSTPKSDGFHVVEQGETLYGIARRYGLSVELIKTWNKLSSNNIGACANLRVKEPVSVAVKKEVSEVKTYDAPTVKFTAKGGTTSTIAKTTSEQSTVKSETTINHYTVAPGETINGLAKRFGYTEERFRKMNNIGAGDIIKVGQIVKTNDCICPIPSDYKAGDGKVAEVVPVSYGFTAKGITKTESNKKESQTIEAPKAIYKRMTVHIVQDDETLSTIAERYNISINDLLAINGLESSDVLIPNQRIHVD
jgi:LysM repeat protein